MPTIHRLPAWLGTIFTPRQPPLDDYKLLPTNHSSNGSSDSLLVDSETPVEQERCYHRDQRSPQRQHGKPRRQPFTLICAHPGVKRTCLPRITLRRFLYCLFFTPFILALGVLLSGVPPTYEDIRTYERLLPQHNITRAKEEGHKYLRFRGQLWGHGLNNILQETILMSYLSYLTNRSFVFDDYVWSHSPFPYTVYDFALRPSRTPFNAFISGPTAGGPISSDFDTRPRPLAVNAEFYSSICPPSKVYLLPSKDAPHDTDGASFIRWWVDRLSSVQETTCVEIDAAKNQVFDLWLFGEKRILTLWDDLSHSPMLRNFSWSHLVLSAVLRNWAILRPPSTFLKSLFIRSSHPPIPLTPDPLAHENATYTRPGFPGLVAVHIRRGDFSRHCHRRAMYNSTYMGFNQFPSFSDVFDPEHYPDVNPSLDGRIGDNDPAITDRESYYMAHCFPSIPQVVARLNKARKDHPGLQRVYVLSNARESWLKELSRELMKLPHPTPAPGSHPKDSEHLERWEDVITGNDLVLDSEQRYVDVAVDMAIAEQAEVFVGNGFSSASSNIVMLRMARGMDPKTNRFL